MADDDDRTGSDWTDAENDAIVADYFTMLGEELASRAYVKSHHNAALQALIGRTRGSIERKHQNVSAVLRELGMPWIFGYKPLPNFQGGLIGAIERHLSGVGRERAYEQAPPPVLHVAEEAALFVDIPVLGETPRRPFELDRLVRKFDPVERDFRNRALGEAGERFVLDVERRDLASAGRADLADRIRWVSMDDGDGAGYDILSFDRAGAERHIEVKTTNGAARTPFFLTRNEVETAKAREQSWHLYRVHLFAQAPRIFTVRPPLDRTLHLDPESWRASFA